MSTERGNVKKSGAPAHQNKTAFHHNKNSKLTRKIAALPNQGLCAKCHDIIEWKKKYRKYKPLKVPGKCLVCNGRSVRHAYHVICQDCAKKEGCREKKEIVEKVVTEEERIRRENNFQEIIKGLSERQRRSLLRRIERGEIDEAEMGFDDFGSDADDDGDDENEDEEEVEKQATAKAKKAPAAAQPQKSASKPKAVEDGQEGDDDDDDDDDGDGDDDDNGDGDDDEDGEDEEEDEDDEEEEDEPQPKYNSTEEKPKPPTRRAA